MRFASSVILLAFLVEGSAQTWTQMPDFPGTARDDAASFSLNGSIFVGTGLDESFTLTNDWYRFDQATEQWSPIADLPATGRQYCASFVAGDFGYLFGGLDANGPLNELWRYDPLSDEWVQRAPLTAAGRYATIAFAVGQYGFVCTGMLDGGSATNETWRYDPVSDTWSARSPVPGPARHRACSAGNTVNGGADAAFQALSDSYSYLYPADVWIPEEDLPEPRFGADGGDGLLFCGASSLATMHADSWQYVWPAPSWDTTSLPVFPGGARRGGAIGLNRYVADVGIIYYGTGLDSALQRHNDWWRLDFPGPGGMSENTFPNPVPFPNPSTGSFTVPIPFPSEIHLADPRGRIVLSARAPANAQVDASRLSPGAYIVTAIDENGRTYRTRWIKQ